MQDIQHSLNGRLDLILSCCCYRFSVHDMKNATRVELRLRVDDDGFRSRRACARVRPRLSATAHLSMGYE